VTLVIDELLILYELLLPCIQVLCDIIQNDAEPAKKKLYELKLSLLDEIGWKHLATYERQWMLVRFPPTLPLF
jgi:tripeptidyl-peptidase-2